jgi:hypothetical protein
MGGMVSMWGQSSAVKSIQYGTITNGGSTATISAVAVENSILFWLGSDCGDNTATVSGFGAITFTSSTVITFSCQGTGNTCSFCVLEFVPGFIKSAGSGSINMASVGSATATISSVNTSKTFLTCIGNTTSDGTPTAMYGRLALTNSTTITASRQFASNSTIVRYSYLEFY